MSHGTVVIPEKVHSIAMEQRWGRSIWVDKTSVGWRSEGGKYLYQEGLVSARGWRGPLLSSRWPIRGRTWRRCGTTGG